MGILARTVPQMNVFIVGFPVQLAVGLSVLVASLPLFYIILNKSLKVLERNYYSFFDFFSWASMAEESFQEKTEQATPKRREEARQKGQVARSNE